MGERFIENDKDKGIEKYIKVPKNHKARVVYMTPLAREVVEYMIVQTNLKCRHNPNNPLNSNSKHYAIKSVLTEA